MSAEIVEGLRNQWGTLVQSVGGNFSLVDIEFNKMIGEYQSGEGRSYHNLVHIGKVDRVLNRYRHLSRNFVSLKFAGDGHDVIYVPGSSANEAESASFMRGVLSRLGVPGSIVAETERIILVTKDHKTTDTDIDGMLMIDADFAIFASSEEEYDAYAKGIWQEYVGSGKVSEEVFKRGRRRLIEGWLSQDRIFLIDKIREELEPQAKINLERELLFL